MCSRVAARHVLCFLIFWGILTCFLLRVNLSVALLEMAGEGEGKFAWPEWQQGLILGSFFWGYLIFQAPGGRIAEVYGVKKVIGGAIVANGVLSVLMPLAAHLHWSLILVNRALQGLVQGVVFPAVSAAAAKWIPLHERGKFMAFATCGGTMGIVVSIPLCGLIMHHMGWSTVFYMSGGVALVWAIAWWLLVYDSPHQHPRISDKERLYLQENLHDTTEEALPVPWKAILGSWQVMLCLVAAWGNDWGFHTFVTLVPKYMKEALGFDLKESSWLSSVPFLCQYLFIVLYGTIGDIIVKRELLTVKCLRRISTFFSHLMPALGLTVIATAGSNATLAVTVLTLSVTFVGAFPGGYYQHPLDIAPNFSGVLTGIMNGCGSATGIISTPIAGAILESCGIHPGWSIIFSIAAVLYVIGALPYMVFLQPQVAPWNSPGYGANAA